MKRIPFLLIFLLLVSCQPAFPKVDSFYVSPFQLTPDEQRSTLGLALSPDGEVMAIAWIGGHELANLRTGERIDLREELGLNQLDTNYRDIFKDQVFWSSDGRYLGIVAEHYGNSPSPIGQVFYRFDLRTKTAKRYELWAAAFSPFDSNQVLTEKGVYNLEKGTIIPLSQGFDFTKGRNLRASFYNDTLWSKELGVPVATLNSIPYDAPKDVELAVESFSFTTPRTPKYSMPTGFISNAPNQLAGYFFDPTGEYVLVLEWQCTENSPKPCDITPFYAENVYDTALTLVRWRTKERRELIRLSSIDPEHVVAYGYMAWSADGSTIFISRKDAPAVVLKVKYP